MHAVRSLTRATLLPFTGQPFLLADEDAPCERQDNDCSRDGQHKSNRAPGMQP
jgi:hypothetical protein